MAVSDAARIDLYNGLAELLGRERAETLMSSLPSQDMSDLATKDDVAALGAATKSDIAGLSAATKSDIAGLSAATKNDIDLLGARIAALEARLAGVEGIVGGLGLRMDRMFLAMLAGLLLIVATMAGVLLSL